MEENVTFGGKEAEPLSVKELATVMSMLNGSKPEVHHISHNCSNSILLEHFKHVDIGDSKDSYYGLPVYKKTWVPLGELWLQDQKGNVIRKFSL